MGSGLAVYEIEAWVIAESSGPADQLALASMGRKPAEGMYLSLDGELVSEYADFRGTIDELTPKGTSGLKSNDNESGTGLLQIITEVVENTSTVAHACAGNDDCSAVDPVYSHRLFDCTSHAQDWQILTGITAGSDIKHLDIFGVECLARPAIELCDLDRHGTIEKHDLLTQPPFMEKYAQVVKNLLCASYRKRRDKHIATIGMSFLKYLYKFFDSVA